MQQVWSNKALFGRQSVSEMPKMVYIGKDGLNGLVKGNRYYISASNIGYADTVRVKAKENLWDKYCYEFRYSSWSSFFDNWRL